MRAYNKRLKHTTEVKAIDFTTKQVRLVAPNSSPTFIYNEKLENIEILENTGVVIDGKEIYVGDKVKSLRGDEFKVTKVGGAYLPFAMPLKEKFTKVD